jgi:hypothetical protein
LLWLNSRCVTPAPGRRRREERSAVKKQSAVMANPAMANSAEKPVWAKTIGRKQATPFTTSGN